MSRSTTTPRSQKVYSASSHPRPLKTPHKVETTAGKAKQTDVRPNLGYYNRDDIFATEIVDEEHKPVDGGFLAHYAPTKVKDSKVKACLKNLCNRTKPVLERAGEGYAWTCFPDYFFKPVKSKPDEPVPLEQRKKQHEDSNFLPLKDIIDAIFETKKEGRKKNYLRFVLCPRSRTQSDIEGGNHMMDGAFTDEKWDGKTMRASAAKIAVELKNSRVDKDKNNQQIFAACHHILNEHPGMMWVYGMTMEFTYVSFWYFSRSHIVKSFSFDWFKDPETFVRAILSFAHATPTELGVDPLVHKGPTSSDGVTRSYVYEVPAGTTGASPVFYKTGKSLAIERRMRLNGRSTRVWEVTQVTSADGDVEVNPGKKLVLKDVWLDHNQATEAENMDQIFKAVDELVTKGLEDQEKVELANNSAFTLDEAVKPRLLKQFIDTDSRFKDFDARTKERLVSYFTDQHYQSLFLTKVYAWKGECSKSLGSQVHHLPELFLSPIIKDPSRSQVGTVSSYRQGTNDPGIATLAQNLQTLNTGGNHQPPAHAREYVRKQQSRVVYEEVCTPVNELQTLGEAVDVLYQAIDALKIVYSVGWVHRDVSTGNILALRANAGWAVKLSDLEFSRPMVDENREASTDPRTGTPFFMPVEIMSESYLFEQWRGAPTVRSRRLNLAQYFDKEDDPNFEPLTKFMDLPFRAKLMRIPSDHDFTKIPPVGAVVNHNYQHDLESIWWILLWLLTVCASHNGETYEGKTDWSSIFKHGIRNYEAREGLFRGEVKHRLAGVVEPLKASFIDWMEILRLEMYTAYTIRALFGQIDMKEAYMDIHTLFSSIFEEMHLDEGDWRQVKLVHAEVGAAAPPPAPLPPPPPPAHSGSTTRSMAAKRARPDAEDPFAAQPGSSKTSKRRR